MSSGGGRTTSFKLMLITVLVMVNIVSVVIRFYPIIGYAPEPVTYEGGTIYYVNDTLRTGHLMSVTDATTLVYPPGASPNSFAAGIIEQAQYPFLPSLLACLLSVTNTSPFS